MIRDPHHRSSIPTRYGPPLYLMSRRGYPYPKRFTFESTSRHLNYLAGGSKSRSILLTCVAYPRIQVIFGGHDSFRDPLEIDVDEFIGIKSFKRKETNQYLQH